MKMAILEVPVPHDFSIAAAKDHLTEVVRLAEAGEDVTLTRRGRPVAVVLSPARYERLREARPDFWSAVERMRSVPSDDDAVLTESDFADLRDRAPGRDVHL